MLFVIEKIMDSNVQYRKNNKIELLEFFIKHVTLGAMEIVVTLNVKGLCISGNLISVKQYYNELSNICNKSKKSHEIKNDEDKEVTESFKKFYDKVGATVPTDPKNLEKYNMKYIYLNNARFYSGFRAIPFESGVLWMGRLESVDGFFIGSLNEAM